MPHCLRTVVAASALTGLLAVAGCNEQAPPAKRGPDTVVVDVIAVAKALGRDTIIQEQMTAADQKLTQQLQEIEQNLESQLKAKRDEFGEQPTPEQQKQLQQLRQVAQQRYTQARVAAQQAKNQYSVALGDQFRNELKPVAERIAKQMGASVAVMNTNTLLWSTPEADITGKVIDELRLKQTQTDTDASGAGSTEGENAGSGASSNGG